MARRSGRAVRIIVDLNGSDKRMEDIEDRGENLRYVFDWAQEELEKANRKNFETGGQPVGNWKRLDAQYASWKAANIPGAPKMFATGRLFRSLSNMSRHGIAIIGDKQAEFGTEVEYAKFHQYGTSKMPKRKIVFTPREFSRDLRKKTADYVANGKARS